MLVSSGGLGPDLSMGLRLATIPGAEVLLDVLTELPWPWRAGLAALRRAGAAAGWQRAEDLVEAGEALLALHDTEARTAFLRTLRSVADVRGQAVTALDRLYLAAALPMLVVWGTRDRIIPVSHAETVTRLVPGARVELFEGAGHWPHLSSPDRFAEVLLEFLADTTPARHDRDTWRSVLAQPASV